MKFHSSEIPQANNPAFILELVSLIANSKMTAETIKNSIDERHTNRYSLRQVQYYCDAAQQLNLLEKIDSTSFQITQTGIEIISQNDPEVKSNLLKNLLLLNPLFSKIIKDFKGTRPTLRGIEVWLEKNSIGLGTDTISRRSSTLNRILYTWYFMDSKVIKSSNGMTLPAWATFMIELGRRAGTERLLAQNKQCWRIVVVPQRNMAAGLFALGFLEASVTDVLASISSIDITKLKPGDAITWRRTDNKVAFGKFLKCVSTPTGELIIEYQDARGARIQRPLDKTKEFNFSPYYGAPFTHDRAMSNNFDFFREFFPNDYTKLLCNSVPLICLIGRPALWGDLRSHEFVLGKVLGCLDDLLRVGGDSENDALDVSHSLTQFVSPDRDELEQKQYSCAIFDGARSFPKLKNFVQACQNLILLDSWESGAVNSVNSFASDCAHAGASMKQTISNLKIPDSIEYAEWSVELL